MKKPEGPANEGRRSFLTLAATAAPVAAVTAVTGAEAEASEAAEEGSGLRKTAHVKAYLDSARF